MRRGISDCFEYSAGNTPLLVSIPHDGRKLPPAVAGRMTPRARELPDTDWHVGRLYDFAEGLGASVITARYSRYVVDLNRSQEDEALYPDRFATGLFPVKTFDGADIYTPGESVSAEEKADRIETYWRPYHDKIASTLKEIRACFGYALLWDAHSIPSRVPLLFDGELPQLNFGSHGGESCKDELIEAVVCAAGAAQEFSVVLDGRFTGGYITRHYGDPGKETHAMQLELAQRCYMNEESRQFDDGLASNLRVVLIKVLQAYLSSAESYYEGVE